MHTKDRLAAELRKAGLEDMATKAAEGYYDDFLSPLDTPIVTLVCDLGKADTPEAKALRLRAMNGDFDATDDEASAWAVSPDGLETFGRLIRKKT